MSESDDEAIKSLLNTAHNDNHREIEDRRKGAIARAKFTTVQKDTFAFSLIKIWLALAEALAPVFAFFAKKGSSTTKANIKK